MLFGNEFTKIKPNRQIFPPNSFPLYRE